jgi:hypothetical protein
MAAAAVVFDHSTAVGAGAPRRDPSGPARCGVNRQSIPSRTSAVKSNVVVW